MNKQDLISQLSHKLEIAQKQSERMLNTALESIVKAVAKGDKVTLVGFGTFQARKRKERRGRNPKTGEAINIPSSIVPKFVAGKEFKKLVNKR